VRRFDLLAKQIAKDLKSGIDWDVTYSGPDAGVYEYVFSYEPQDGCPKTLDATRHGSL
jgi:hypothetical protein